MNITFIELLKGQGYNPNRDEHGRFASGPGGGASGGGKGKPPPKAVAPTPKQLAASKKALAGLKSLRNASRPDVVNVNHEAIAKMDPHYVKHTQKGGDMGAVHSLHWNPKTTPPKDYPKSWPSKPRETYKGAPHDYRKIYELPNGITLDYLNKSLSNEMLNPKERAKVEHLAKVITHELYTHAKQRQGELGHGGDKNGNAWMFNKGGWEGKHLKEKGLNSTAWEFHHMIPAAMGGSNSAHNIALMRAGEHSLSHTLEAILAPTIKVGKDGSQKFGKNNMGSFPTMQKAAASRIMNSITKQIASQVGQYGHMVMGTGSKMGGKPIKDKALLKEKRDKILNNQYVKWAVAAGINFKTLPTQIVVSKDKKTGKTIKEMKFKPPPDFNKKIAAWAAKNIETFYKPRKA